MQYKTNIQTFDVFDTLIARRCIILTNIFFIVENKLGIEGFGIARQEAEQALLGGKYGLDDIYKNLKKLMDIPDELIEILKNAEIDEEIDNIIPIKENMEKVRDGDILVSDMYLREETIRKLLKKSGFNKECPVIVSNYGKHAGTIWPEILSSFNIIKHLGDNVHADGRSPAEYGIDFEITDKSLLHPYEKILFDLKFTMFGAFVREVRLKTWEEGSIDRKIQEIEFFLNFPILFI